MRFYVTSDEQHDALLEALKATKRAWSTGSYAIEDQEQATQIVTQCSDLLDRFSIFPRPVFWTIDEYHHSVLQWIFDFYTDTHPVQMFYDRRKQDIQTVNSLRTNFK